MIRVLVIGLSVAVLIGFPAALAAQQMVSLRVSDQTGAAIREAQVVSISVHGDIFASTKSDAVGHASLPCHPGSMLQVHALGFEARVSPLKDCSHELIFKLAPASVETTLNVIVAPDTAPSELTETATTISRTTARTVFDAVEDLSPAIFVTRRGVMG